MIPGIAPVYGVKDGYAEQRSTPAIAASPEPIAKVMEIVLFTLIPINWAAPLSSDTASIACPVFVLLIKSISPAMIRIPPIMVTMVTPVITIEPPASFRDGRLITLLNDLVSAPQIRRATF